MSSTRPVKKLPLRQELARSVCMFLAEMLRTRQVTLERSAEIAARIVVKLPELKSEEQFLKLIEKMEFEFQEVCHLKRDVLFYRHIDERVRLEELVREFAIERLPLSPEKAVAIMEEALRQEIDINHLKHKFPEFDKFIKDKEAENGQAAS